MAEMNSGLYELLESHLDQTDLLLTHSRSGYDNDAEDVFKRKTVRRGQSKVVGERK